MKFSVDVDSFDSFITASDWRYSAAIIGLMEYFEYNEFSYDIRRIEVSELGFLEEGILYSSKDITEENYLKFVEHYFEDEFQHCRVEKLLKSAEELSEETIKEVNELLSGPGANTIMKKTFPKVKYDDTTKAEIINTIEKNRMLLIKETYRNKKSLYANYSNTNSLLKNGGEICRLNGYYVDLPKKGKSLGYGFDKSKITSQDDVIFDFIPMAFCGGREKYFINNNVSIKTLKDSFYKLKEIYVSMIITSLQTGKKINSHKLFWAFICSAMKEKSFDLEVVSKSQDQGYFATLYVRRRSAEILKWLDAKNENGSSLYDILAIVYTPDDGKTYIDVQKETIQSIINLTVLDGWIDFFLKEEMKGRNNYFRKLLARWIHINEQIRNGGNVMNRALRKAWGCAREVSKSKNVDENKLRAYRTKLISSIISHDYDRTCEILLHLSNYSKVDFSFAYDLFEDFEGNKNIVYTFINGLDMNKNSKGSKSEDTEAISSI